MGLILTARKAEAGALSHRLVFGGFIPLIALTLLLSGGQAQEAEAATLSVTATPIDSVPSVRPRLFEGPVLFSTEYLSRVLSLISRPSASAIVVETPPPDEQGRAAAYARKYGIDQVLALQIVESALAEGVDPDLAFRLVRVESVFKPAARGRGGSLGLTQLMPATARAVDRTLRSESQILEPETNLRTGFRYLRMMIERYDGNVRLGLLAYNRGEGTVDVALRQGRDPENGYSGRVLGAGGDNYSGSGLVIPR